MATSFFGSLTGNRSPMRRALVISGAVLIVIVVVWQLSGRDVAVAAAAAAPIAVMGLLLARDRVKVPLAVDHDHPSRAGEWEAFKREIDRSRRHERPLALAAASLPDDARASGLLAETVVLARGRMRSIDLLWYDGSGLWLLMPESRREGALRCIGRVTEAAPLTKSAAWRLVVFPDDAPTVGALIAKLQETQPLDLDGLTMAEAA